jgi:hypothetical protein
MEKKVMEKRNKNIFRHSVLDAKFQANKEIANKVRNDAGVIRNTILFIVLLFSMPCIIAQNTGYMGKRVIFNMGAEFSPAWKRPVCNVNFNNKYLRFNCILSPSIEIIVHKKGTAGLVYHYLGTKYNAPYTKDDYDTSYFGNDGMYILTNEGEITEDLKSHGFGFFYKQYFNGRAPMGPYLKFQFDGFFFKCPISYDNRTITINDKLFAMKLEFGNDFLLFDRLRLSTGFSFGLPFGGFKALGHENEWGDIFNWNGNGYEQINEHARSRILGAYWLGFTVSIGFLAF